MSSRRTNPNISYSYSSKTGLFSMPLKSLLALMDVDGYSKKEDARLASMEKK